MPSVTSPANDIFDAVFERSLDFRIQLNFDDACQFLRRIEQYNDYEASNVLAALERVDALIPKKYYGEGNPNNGRRRYDLSVGREGSPVLYIELYEFGDEDQLSLDAMKLICREMELVGRADEADYETKPNSIFGGRKVTFRFWWD